MKDLYEKYSIYLTRQNFEIFSVMMIVIFALIVFTSSIPSQGVLTLDNKTIKYDGNIVRGKMNGQGTLTFKNGDVYKGSFKNGSFNGKGTFTAKAGWKYEGDFVNGQPEGQGVLTTEGKAVYKGKFKQGIYQNAH
ncbi:hypothetical protein GCM10011510_09770 [Streptococcus himalayensis]|uniref:MORN repeat protein n=2 Tax=Streptococcus himalayensis TaxID=1888195 RepID=A0A917A691_9STRE|nr:hypothetical protein GCM10011510_09770 [Streptococcus himalayensis]